VPRLFTAFREGVHELGYVEGQNIQLVVKSAQGRPDLLSGLAAELVALKPAVVVTTGVAVRVVRRASPTIPIVVAATRDAVTAGFTSSLAKPADNITGQSFLNTELSAKRLALLKDTVPRARRIAMLVYVDSGPDRDVRETRTRALGVALLSEEVRGPADFERVFAVMVQRASRRASLHPRRSDPPARGPDCGLRHTQSHAEHVGRERIGGGRWAHEL
jgi:putative ABC transport system substrate-binding protein